MRIQDNRYIMDLIYHYYILNLLFCDEQLEEIEDN